jgi:hypothetical protein
MGDGEQDLDGFDQGVDDGEDLGLGGGADVASGGKTLSLFERWLDGQISGEYDAVIGKSALQQMRYAVGKLKKVTAEAAAAEQRGYDRARQELRSEVLDEATRQQLKAEYVAQLRTEDGRARNLRRLGVPDELASLFPEDLDGDFKAWQRKADQLHAAGVHWGDGDPLVRQAAAARLQAWEQAQANGQPVSLDPGGPAPEAVRQAAIAEQVTQMQATQAGSQQVGAESLLDEARKMARDPDAYSEDQRLDLAERFNRDLEALSRQASGGPL